LDQAEKLCHRVGILFKGKKAADGAIDELRCRLAEGGSLEEIFFAVTSGDIESIPEDGADGAMEV